jgi:hypothetical protein
MPKQRKTRSASAEWSGSSEAPRRGAFCERSVAAVQGRPPLAQYVQENLAIDFRGAHATEEDSLLGTTGRSSINDTSTAPLTPTANEHESGTSTLLLTRTCSVNDDRQPSAAPSRSCDDRPLSVLLFLLMWPFWLFRDSTRGDRFARAAAYRHNRDMRVHLPGYLMRWSLAAALVFGLMAATESLASSLSYVALPLMLVAVVFGIVFSASICVLFVTAYIYWYLSRNE